jgi:hypothetical protein
LGRGGKKEKEQMSVGDTLENGQASINVYNLEVEGTTTFAGGVTIAGPVTFEGDVTVTGETTTVDNLVVLGTLTDGNEVNPGAPLYQENAGGLSASEIVGNPSAVVLPGATYNRLLASVTGAGNLPLVAIPAGFRAYVTELLFWNTNLATSITVNIATTDPPNMPPGTYSVANGGSVSAGATNAFLCNYVFGPGEIINVGASVGNATVYLTYCLFPDDGSGDAGQNPFQMQSSMVQIGTAAAVVMAVPATTPAGNPIQNAFGVLLNSCETNNSPPFAFDNGPQLLGPVAITTASASTNTVTMGLGPAIAPILIATGSLLGASAYVNQFPLTVVPTGNSLVIKGSSATGIAWSTYCFI